MGANLAQLMFEAYEAERFRAHGHTPRRWTSLSPDVSDAWEAAARAANGFVREAARSELQATAHALLGNTDAYAREVAMSRAIEKLAEMRSRVR